MEQFIKIGQIVNTHGCRGELKVLPLTDDPGRFEELTQVYVFRKDRDYIKYNVASARIHKGMVLVAFAEINDLLEAEKMKGLYLELPVSELKPLPEGHYYIFQLIGLNVYEDDKLLGKMIDVIKTGSNDVYVVKAVGSKKEILIPALKEVVEKIDLSSGAIRVKLPPGLLDL
ncbi:MAG: ribosome maturation factor RimM [Peptococcaceae bacterium]|jgi:16S rRNA processing protein RimM|nr:ribosome maturation factor RimM [Peptococcaceae bacterium]MDH7525680.1 ribosome maturation factor RimM [Peptococcaceae bacterium]